MTEYKRGDRVKVTIEGVVDEAGGAELYVNNSDDEYIGYLPQIDRAGVTIDKLADPLPTTPGSVIRYVGPNGWQRNDPHGLRFLNSEGRWLYDDGRDRGGISRPDTYEIVFDAGRVD